MTYDYRRALPDDATDCAGILRDWIAETPWMPMLHTQASMAHFWHGRLTQASGWIAQRDGQIAGFCVRDKTFITALHITHSARNAGVGMGLLDLARENCDEVSLWVFEANTRARAFYRRAGFTEAHRTNGDNEEGLPDIRLDWRQPAPAL